ncbi:hypothetical protein ACWD6Z_19410, partial [Streptomyces californicus]
AHSTTAPARVTRAANSSAPKLETRTGCPMNTLIVIIVKSQGGPNKTKEDGAVDAAFARAEAAKQTAHPENG